MNARTSISVVIPAYNAARWVAEAVDSALAQTLPPSQIIVVDDGSTDDTAAVLRPYAERRVVTYLLQPNSGVAAARNAGIAAATGELIAFLDADDAWHPRKLELQADVLAQRPELAMLGTAVYEWPLPARAAAPDPLAATDDQTGPGPFREIAWSALIVRNCFTTSSIVVRRSALAAAAGDAPPFDPELHGPEDYDLWLRLAERFHVAILASPLTGYREVPGSLGKRARTMEAGVHRILRKVDERGAWNRAAGDDVPGGARIRRRAYATFYYTCGYMHSAAGSQCAAVARVIHSLLSYPLPLIDGKVRCARLRLLGVSLLRLMRLKPLEDGAST
jgi:glycosyltransferase involved in cell wall biosynthesis